MHRFKISGKTENYFKIAGEELHHLINVLRLKPEDKIVGFDNSGRQWQGVIDIITEDEALCRIYAEEYPQVEAQTKVYIVMGLAKGEKIEWVIQKGTELGMTGFIPLQTQRSVVKLEGQKALQRVSRWQKIATEAVKQSRRVVEPEIKPITGWEKVKDSLPAGTQWVIAYEDEKTVSLSNTLKGFNPEYPIAILIGPEGGFTAEEVAKAREDLAAQSVTLGPRILRTETAAIAALVIILAYYGQLG
ncbi:MAG TPA: 16S rRNA (uracil(1498)-N(3))-methyltransferase [Peptococcaceae bacterium]|nr:16S rRNA (uracil(1498)-N(3))-methyltransferase [Peptococcaceae bacterium]